MSRRYAVYEIDQTIPFAFVHADTGDDAIRVAVKKTDGHHPDTCIAVEFLERRATQIYRGETNAIIRDLQARNPNPRHHPKG